MDLSQELKCSGLSPICKLKREPQRIRKWAEVQSFHLPLLWPLPSSLYLWHERSACAFIINHFPHLDIWSSYLGLATSSIRSHPAWANGMVDFIFVIHSCVLFHRYKMCLTPCCMLILGDWNYFTYNLEDHFIHLYYPDSVQHHGHINDTFLIQFLKEEAIRRMVAKRSNDKLLYEMLLHHWQACLNLSPLSYFIPNQGNGKAVADTITLDWK